jgi:3-oxoacyl-[acyl-carrier protein] reductase
MINSPFIVLLSQQLYSPEPTLFTTLSPPILPPRVRAQRAAFIHARRGCALSKGQNMSRFKGKVALVTGASKGIGAGIAKALAAQGASVVVNYASARADADQVVAAITAAGGEAIAAGGNVSKAADAKAIVNAAVETYGRLDILVNNAGVYDFAGIDEISEAHFHKHFDVNVLGLLLVTQAAAKHIGEGGSIVNIGSVVSRVTPPGMAVYNATKGAVDAITSTLAKELGSRKIRVNSVNPGMVATEGARAIGVIGSDLEAQMIAQTPLGRIARPDDIADIVTFLASDDARWLTGESLLASGGMR